MCGNVTENSNPPRRHMDNPDFNLLLALDALLSEGSVAGAARRMHLSTSAMSRALARLREVTGDPLLVRAGRGLVPSPRALELREMVSMLVQDAQTVLRPAQEIDLQQLSRTFTLRSREGFVENFGAELVARAAQQAPGVRLCFMQKTDKDNTGLRDGSVDLETGVVSRANRPEIRVQALFRDRFIGVVRQGHALSRLGAQALSVEQYASGGHISISRRGLARGQLDEALQELGLQARIVTIVGSFSAALALARATDLIATVPERHTADLRRDMYSFALPLRLQSFTLAMMWHPRMDADPGHRWLRKLVHTCCAEFLPCTPATPDIPYQG